MKKLFICNVMAYEHFHQTDGLFSVCAGTLQLDRNTTRLQVY